MKQPDAIIPGHSGLIQELLSIQNSFTSTNSIYMTSIKMKSFTEIWMNTTVVLILCCVVDFSEQECIWLNISKERRTNQSTKFI